MVVVDEMAVLEVAGEGFEVGWGVYRHFLFINFINFIVLFLFCYIGVQYSVGLRGLTVDGCCRVFMLIIK